MAPLRKFIGKKRNNWGERGSEEIFLVFVIILAILLTGGFSFISNQNINTSYNPPSNSSTDLSPPPPTTYLTPTSIPLADCTSLPSSSQKTSPLIFGTNIGTQFMQSQKTRDLFKQIHVKFLRVGFLSPDDSSSLTPNETAMLTTLRDMCITPLIILHYRVHGKDPTSVDSVIVRGIASIFQGKPVYYELGNEPDIAGIHADKKQYAAQWNKVIGAVKKLDSNAKFGGPVVSQALPDYISYFYHNTSPRPDFVSWHEYNCGNNDPASKCIDRLNDWTRNVGWIRSAIKKNGDPTPPIIISEWNYDSVVKHPDSRATSSFLHTYVQTAFTKLSQNGIFAAAHFKSTDFTREYLLITHDDTLTAEGDEFQKMYESLIGK